MLRVEGLWTGYGKKEVLSGVSVRVQAGEIVGLIGPNGSGKSTLLKAISGLLPAWDGTIHFGGEPTKGVSTSELVSRGLGFAPQGSRVFKGLTVLENLRVAGSSLPRTAMSNRIDAVLQFFPELQTRLQQPSGQLSGGEQQMLGLARSMVPVTELLLLDEPSLGLAPSLVGRCFERIVQLNKSSGVTVLIVEQRVRQVLEICHRAYGLRLGQVAFAGTPEQLVNDEVELRKLFL